MKALYKCTKIAQSLQHKTTIWFGVIVFLFKSLNVLYLSFQHQHKYGEKITLSLLNQHVFH